MPTYIGTNGNDTVTSGFDRLYGADGDDLLSANAPGYNVIEGGAGWDYLFFGSTSTFIYGSAYGGEGNDSIFGYRNNDLLYGGNGNDLILGGYTNGQDSNGYFLQAIGYESGDDHIDGGADIDALYGFDGNDVIYGGDGNDSSAISVPQLAFVNDGRSFYTVPAGLFGGAGNDYLDGGRGNDFLDGGTGNDALYGGEGNDVLSGNDGADFVDGGAGEDLVAGGTGNDSLFGGTGNDVLRGGTGSDTMDGGAGLDYAIYDDATAGVTARLDFGVGSAGDAAGDAYWNIEGLFGSSFNDTLIGDGRGNLLNGGSGADTLLGQGGADTLIGGAGSDSFVFAAIDNVNGSFDTLADFQDGIDAVVLQGWNPATLVIAQGGADTFITTLDSGYTTGIIVANTTVAQLVDQVLFV